MEFPWLKDIAKLAASSYQYKISKVEFSDCQVWLNWYASIILFLSRNAIANILIKRNKDNRSQILGGVLIDTFDFSTPGNE